MSGHEAIIFHATGPVIHRLRGVDRLSSFVIRHDTPDVLADDIVRSDVGKHQLGILRGIVVSKIQRLAILGVKVPDGHVHWRIRAPAHVRWTCDLRRVLADHWARQRIDLERVALVPHAKDLKVQGLVGWRHQRPQAWAYLLDHRSGVHVATGDGRANLVRECQRVWPDAREEAIEAVPLSVAIDSADVWVGLLFGIGLFASLQERPILRLGIHGRLFQGFLGTARREISCPATHAAKDLQGRGKLRLVYAALALASKVLLVHKAI
mmetsp:Transcript_57261/g.123909  ORF Transcript_57261/g.123909 Transcript_57261/m.123909 type:complete len:266 (+) Transcript_57261:78-875(+)